MGSQDAALQDVDYISFLFSTLTGFSSEDLALLQDAPNDSTIPPSPLSPLSLYPTPLEQFTHHWDVVEVRPLAHVYLQKNNLQTPGDRSPEGGTWQTSSREGGRDFKQVYGKC